MRTLTGTQGKALICAYLDRLARNTLDENIRLLRRPITLRVLASLQDQLPILYALCLVETAKFTLHTKAYSEFVRAAA